MAKFTWITPAYMGNTNISPNKTSHDEDHPRIHGEHAATASLAAVGSGSPPHTWGTHLTNPAAKPF